MYNWITLIVYMSPYVYSSVFLKMFFDFMVIRLLDKFYMYLFIFDKES